MTLQSIPGFGVTAALPAAAAAVNNEPASTRKRKRAKKSSTANNSNNDVDSSDVSSFNSFIHSLNSMRWFFLPLTNESYSGHLLPLVLLHNIILKHTYVRKVRACHRHGWRRFSVSRCLTVAAFTFPAACRKSCWSRPGGFSLFSTCAFGRKRKNIFSRKEKEEEVKEVFKVCKKFKSPCNVEQCL